MRRLIPAGVAALAATACGGAGSAPPPIEAHAWVDVAGLPATDVQVRIQHEHRRDTDRYLGAAVATIAATGRWLAPFPRPSITIVDPPRYSAPAALADAVVIDRTPWWTTPTAMAPEIAAARGVSRRVWSDLVDTRALPAWFVEGLAEYTARRVIAPLFERNNNPPGYAFLEERYFGLFVPHFVRVRLLSEADGDPLAAYRAKPTASISASSADGVRSLAAKTVLAIATLERWLGQPVLDDVLAQFVRASRGARPTMAGFERTASEVSGQNLSWFFDQTFRASSVFDYGVERLTSEAETDGSYTTTVVARRYGEALFTGSSAPRVGPFESGRGVTVLVTFADGGRRLDHWDGRDREKTFVYRGARALSAEVDPDRTLLLDLKRMYNGRTLAPRSAAAATRWAGRWLIWMQDLLLSYASLV